MDQVVERLPSKLEALNLNPRITKIKGKRFGQTCLTWRSRKKAANYSLSPACTAFKPAVSSIFNC
jgi:hypothetical protein